MKIPTRYSQQMKKRIMIILVLVLLLVVSCGQNTEQGVDGQAARDKEALVGEAGEHG